MSRLVPIVVLFCAALGRPFVASAQTTIDLATGAADPVWHGTSTSSHAGLWLDQGALNSSDTRRDLVVGAPGDATIAGSVYVIFGGATRTGQLALSAADTVLTGSANGDLFGFSTATGSILSSEGSNPKNLVVGAPGSLSNKGIVYVYSSGYRHGDVVATSAAVARVIGQPGDRLGYCLATADLDNDGYREIVIGAPGNGRIYVIRGGPSLSGTIDLSVTAAALSFTYPGLGYNLSAGDVTGDGIYDLLVGLSSANAVNILKGRNGSMPPAAFDMTFGGIDAGDGVGTSVRLADVDADGTSDVIVGAPGGDGPANSKADAGEAYLIFGGPTLTGRSMASADVTFYGAESGGRFSDVLSAGDINRDTPNDLVFVSSGARSGAGTIQVYYGRKRGSMGYALGDGRRIVDFSVEEPSRGFLGDPAGGSISSVIVFEVTGEGARDVIVGMSGHGGGNGAVYFTISPRLSLGASSVSLSGYQGVMNSSPVSVTNISQIPITWSTSSNRSWLSATPSGATSVSSSGDLVIYANGDGLAPGTYTGTITVTSTSPHLTMSQTIAVTVVLKETQPSTGSAPAAGYPPGARYDILWRHSTEGWLALWNMNGLTWTGTQSLSMNQVADLTWNIAGMGDLNGDGYRDIVWQNNDGHLVAWFLRGNQVLSFTYLSLSQVADTNWKIRGVGDTNGDGKADLLWQNTATGHLVVWYMDGAQVLSFGYLSMPQVADTTWKVQAAGDVNGDGRADVIWRNSASGELVVWFLDGRTVSSFAKLSIPAVSDMTWNIAGASDVNGDGRADLLWQNSTTGQLVAWYLNGATVNATLLLNPDRVASTTWKIQGPK